MRWLNGLADLAYKVSGLAVTILLGVVALLVFLQVSVRFVLDIPITWSTELTTYLMIWMVFLGASMGLRDGELIALTTLSDRLPKRGAAIVAVLIDVLVFGFLATCLFYNSPILKMSMKQFSPVLGLRMGWVALSLTIACLLMILYLVESIARRIAEIRRNAA